MTETDIYTYDPVLVHAYANERIWGGWRALWNLAWIIALMAVPVTISVMSDWACCGLPISFLLAGRYAKGLFDKPKHIVEQAAAVGAFDVPRWHAFDEEFFTTHLVSGSYDRLRWQYGLFSKVVLTSTHVILIGPLYGDGLPGMIPLRAFQAAGDLERLVALATRYGARRITNEHWLG